VTRRTRPIAEWVAISAIAVGTGGLLLQGVSAITESTTEIYIGLAMMGTAIVALLAVGLSNKAPAWWLGKDFALLASILIALTAGFAYLIGMIKGSTIGMDLLYIEFLVSALLSAILAMVCRIWE
jgi:hypothetical protein